MVRDYACENPAGATNMIGSIRFLNVILISLLAGASFGIWVGLNPKNYSASTYIEQLQNLVHSLNSLFVTLVILVTLITIASAFLQRENKTILISLIFAALFLISCIFISRFGNLPIQNEILSWNANSFPQNWTTFRDKWWDFHIIRTIAELIALVVVVWTSVQPTNNKISEKTKWAAIISIFFIVQICCAAILV